MVAIKKRDATANKSKTKKGPEDGINKGFEYIDNTG
jgi:hypothetical protein